MPASREPQIRSGTPVGTAVLRVSNATLSVGAKTLWRHLNLEVEPGEFIAVLGANGAGKTALLQAIVGARRLDRGQIEVDGQPPAAGNRAIGYVPQTFVSSEDAGMRGRDLVGLAVDGHRFGLPLPSARRRSLVAAALAATASSEFADRPLGALSGGQQQRIRIAQAIVTQPKLLLCDEPLSALDLRAQRQISELINRQRIEHNTAVLFVTHDLNPVLDLVDRVIYFGAGEARVGRIDEVMRSDVLSDLYGSPVEVVRLGGRLVVLGAAVADHLESHHHDQQHRSGRAAFAPETRGDYS